MARIGSATAPSFSPDGRWLSVIANVSGLPQVYVIPAEGGWPRMITDGTGPGHERRLVSRARQQLDRHHRRAWRRIEHAGLRRPV